jgi:hypothetical protein
MAEVGFEVDPEPGFCVAVFFPAGFCGAGFCGVDFCAADLGLFAFDADACDPAGFFAFPWAFSGDWELFLSAMLIHQYL